MSNLGFIYVLINPSIKGLVKIGKTRRSPEQRAEEISIGTGVPTRFFVAFDVQASDCDIAESLIHQELAQYRENEDREFFRISLKLAIGVVQTVAAQLPVEDEAPVNADQQDEHGLTPLMRACLHNHPDRVRELLEAGADPDFQTDDGSTALIMAAAKGYSQIVDLLLQAGADLNIKMKDGNTALAMAQSRGKTFTVNTIEYYLRTTADSGQVDASQKQRIARKNKQLLAACQSRDFQTVKQLLEARCEANFASENGATPLMLAAANGDLETVELLLHHGARPDTRNSRGETALDIAEAKGRLAAANLILNFKASGNPS